MLHETDEMKIISTHTPIGVVGAICPWNFPLVLATAKIAAALVMGNCIIVKPSPFTPYSTLKFAELATDMLPAGVFQALSGEAELGELMTLHHDIDKISFTGSTSTGKKIMQAVAPSLKRLTLELGGNDAAIIFPNVVVDEVAPQVAVGCFFNAGQMCVATKRVYVHESIYEKFRDSFVNAVRALAEAPEPSSVAGPLQNEMQHAVIQRLITDCREKGYHFALGGNQPPRPGLFISPVVIDRPPGSATVVQEEQFGMTSLCCCQHTRSNSTISRANHPPSAMEHRGGSSQSRQRHKERTWSVRLVKGCRSSTAVWPPTRGRFAMDKQFR